MTSTLQLANLGPLALYATLATAAWGGLVYRDTSVLWGLALLVVPFVPASNVLFPVGVVVGERVSNRISNVLEEA